jgi:hypothetical protein
MRSHRLAVRTSPFHGGSPGSIIGGSPHTVLACSRADIKALRRNGSGLFYSLKESRMVIVS